MESDRDGGWDLVEAAEMLENNELDAKAGGVKGKHQDDPYPSGRQGINTSTTGHKKDASEASTCDRRLEGGEERETM